jgi:hypothetical protein
MPKNKNNDSKLNIFSRVHLSLFAKELREAGGFDELMISKKALERVDGRSYILSYPNTKEYKNQYLIGKYRGLRPFFSTKVPYSFWSQLYVALRKDMGASQ